MQGDLPQFPSSWFKTPSWKKLTPRQEMVYNGKFSVNFMIMITQMTYTGCITRTAVDLQIKSKKLKLRSHMANI